MVEVTRMKIDDTTSERLMLIILYPRSLCDM
jgi:hypothetical protein